MSQHVAGSRLTSNIKIALKITFTSEIFADITRSLAVILLHLKFCKKILILIFFLDLFSVKCKFFCPNSAENTMENIAISLVESSRDNSLIACLTSSDSDEDIDIQGARLKLNVRKVNSGKDASNILLPVNVCGVELDIDPDTGADVDLISKDDFQKIYQQHPDVEKLISVPKEAIRALGGAKLGIICVLKGAKLSNKTVKNLVRDIYVTENGIHNHPLLSEKTLLELGMVQYSADGEFELIEQMPKESFEEEIAALLFEPDSESDRIILKRANEDKDYQILRNIAENDLWKSHTNNPIISKFYGVATDLSVVKGLVFYKDLLVPPFVMQSAFIDEVHKIGHSGEKRTVDLLRERMWFPGMTKLAKDAIKSCLSCQMTFDRTICLMNGKKSHAGEIRCGVPQGSNLAPSYSSCILTIYLSV